MVFFNYSTMQMAAKVVYYGPGLCGKTTNLHWIYQHTSSDSRGEMVSLETETDRTLFFDLLPLDVGSIAGFNTRLQLYTVPGQVFYNTTRKLVLKGVDGIVFVADSQRPMLQANIDSWANLEENLAEMGLTAEKLPVVLQYNKRDLSDILTVDELNEALNPRGIPFFEASAVNGEGVLETLKGVSKLTLLSLQERLVKGSSAETTPTAAPRARPRPKPPTAQPRPQAAATGLERPEPTPTKTPTRTPAVLESTGTGTGIRPPQPAKARPRQKAGIDALGKLEELRREAMGSGRRATQNGSAAGQLFRDIQLTLPRADFERARRFTLSLQVHDDSQEVVESVSDLEFEIDNPADLQKVLLKLNIALRPKP